jgi:hypothetical protein
VRIEFSIMGLPPKKDGANSMWNKENEVPKIIALRQGALQAIRGIGTEEAIRDFIKLELVLNIPRHQMKQNIGDLDNFITGICDGLQSANSMAKIHSMFSAKGLEDISPNHSFIENDLQVVEILAKKIPLDADSQISYTIVIETVTI